MTDKEILKKAIEKAVKNGWLPKLNDGLLPKDFILIDENKRIYLMGAYRRYEFNSIEEIIFNHDFAKALCYTKKVRKYVICSNKKCAGRDCYKTEVGKDSDFYKTAKDIKDLLEHIKYCQSCGSKQHVEKLEIVKNSWCNYLQTLVVQDEGGRYKYLKTLI